MITWPWIALGIAIVVGSIALALVMTRKRDDDEEIFDQAVPETVMALANVDEIYKQTAKSYLPHASHAEVVVKIPAKKVAAKKVAAKKTATAKKEK